MHAKTVAPKSSIQIKIHALANHKILVLQNLAAQYINLVHTAKFKTSLIHNLSTLNSLRREHAYTHRQLLCLIIVIDGTELQMDIHFKRMWSTVESQLCTIPFKRKDQIMPDDMAVVWWHSGNVVGLVKLRI